MLQKVFGVGGCFYVRIAGSFEARLSVCDISSHSFLIWSSASNFGVDLEGGDVSIVTISVVACLIKSSNIFLE